MQRMRARRTGFFVVALWIATIFGGRSAGAQTISFPDRWRLCFGDKPGFSDPAFDDSRWTNVWVPSQLGEEGFDFPPGTVWYRVHFDVSDRWVGKPVWLVLGKVDAADETWLNGAKVGSMGRFPPNAQTAWSETRFYPLAAGQLKKHNVLAIRVWRWGDLGGVTDGPLGIYDEADFQKAFHPPAGARATFHQLVTGNGLTTAVYDFEHDMVRRVLPHAFRAYDERHTVQAVIRHLRPCGTARPEWAEYVDNSHVICVHYGKTDVFYFAPFTADPRIFCADVRGPVRDVLAWRFEWDAGVGHCADDAMTFYRANGLADRYFVFAVTDERHADASLLPRALQRLSASKGTLLDAELSFMHQVVARCHFPAGLRPAERNALEQSVAVLKMAQVSQQEVLPRAAGQIVACLPPGAWNTTWVRDGFYSTMALSRLGLYDEAKRMLSFELNADSGHYASYIAPNGHDVGVGVPYRISVCRYFGDGTEESFGDDKNIELDGFGLFLMAFTDYVERSADMDFYKRYADVVSTQVADVIVHCIASDGLIRPESGPWERYLDFKQFAYTSVACAQGLRRFARLQARHGRNGERYDGAAERISQAIQRILITRAGWIKGNAEVFKLDGYDSHDGGTFEAFSLGLLTDARLFGTQLAEYSQVLSLPGEGRGFSRINKGDSYETAEWVLLNLRVSSAMAQLGDQAGAHRLADWVTAQAALNHNLIPEMYRRDNSAYDGAIPMVGFGAGAYVLTMLDMYGQP